MNDTVCADLNPWDSQLRCVLQPGHAGLHEAFDCVRWSDRCHFDGDDDCEPRWAS